MAGRVISRETVIYDIMFPPEKAAKGLKETGRNIDRIERKADSFGKKMIGAAGALTGLFAIEQVVGEGIRDIAAYEKALDSLQAITGVTAKEMDFFKKESLDLGNELKKSSIEIVESFEIVGSAAPELLKNQAALAAVTKESIILSKATGGKLGLEGAAQALTSVMNQFNEPASKAREIINQLASGSKLGAAGIDLQAQSIEKFGAVASEANISTATSIALVEVLAGKNIKGAEAGTQLRNVILRLQKAGLGYQSGVFNITDALEELDAKQLSVTEKAKIFGDESITAGQILLKNTDQVKSLTEALQGSNIAYEQAAIQSDNILGAVEALQQAWEDITLDFESGSGVIKDSLFFIADNMRLLLRVATSLVAGLVAYKVALLVARNATIAANVATVAYRITKIALTQGIRAATVAMRAFNTASKASPLGFVIGLLTTVIGLAISFAEETENAAEAQVKLNEAMKEAIAQEDDIGRVLGKLANGNSLASESMNALRQTASRLREDLNEMTGDVFDVVVAGKVYTQNMDEQRAKITELITAINNEIRAREKAEEATGNQADKAKKQKDALELLREEIALVTRELELQALAGNITAEKVQEYKDLTGQLEEAQRRLKEALAETTDGFKEQNDAIDKGVGDSINAAIEESLAGIERFNQAYIELEQARNEAIQGLAIQGVHAIGEIERTRMEQRLSLLQEQRDRELEAAGEDEAKRAVLEEQFAQREARLRKQIAISERAAKVFDIFIETQAAIAAIKATAAVLLADPFTAPLAANALSQIPFVVASAGLSTASILSAPLPGFKKGTKSAPGGMAIVGEEGPEIVNLPQGSQVMDANKTKLFNTLLSMPALDVAGVERAIGQKESQGERNGRDYGPLFNRIYKATRANGRVHLNNTREVGKVIAKEITEAQGISNLYN